jgi:hypothetical protein
VRRLAGRAGIHARLIGSFLSAWVLFPLVLLGASVGCGLLVRRVAHGELSALLVTPVGFALLVVICAFATSYGWLAPSAGLIVVVVAVLGFALEARARPIRRPDLRPAGPWIWPLLAALVAFTAVGGPVFLTGNVGWTGYTRIVDLAFQLDFAQHLADAGRVAPPNGHSSYNIVTTKLLGIGYPGGAQATLGAVANLVHTNVAWCYQAFLAFVAAMGAIATYSLLGRVTRNGLMRCIGGAVAIQPNVLYGYALEAGIKELTTAGLLLVVVAVLAERPPGDGRRLGVVPLAVSSSAAFGAFSLGIAPWLGLLLAGAFLVSLIRRPGRRRVLEGWAIFAAVAIVITLPGLVTAAKLANVAGTAVGGVVDLGLGNLAAPVSRWSSAGVWLTGDYRYPLAHTTTSHVFDVIIVALAVLGVLAAVLRRRWAVVVLGVAAPVALYYFIEHSTAWIQFKAFTITAVFSVTLAFAGAGALQSSRRRWLAGAGWLAALAVAGGVLYGNALIYHDTSLAPGARYHDLAAIAKRYAGHGPALDPYFDEYAEYFLRGESGSALVDPANLTFQLRPGVPLPYGGQSFAWDLNQLIPSYLESFPLIIQPRNPTASRAPSNYDLVERTRFFDVWRRDRPSNTVLVHYPFSSQPHERTPAFCHTLSSEARSFGPGTEVAYAKTSTAAVANPAQGAHPDYWKLLGPSTLAAYGAGTAQTNVVLPTTARYGIWLQGSVGRPLVFDVDGKRFSSIGYEERYPNQFLPLGVASLQRGSHTLRLVRGGGSLHPGSGDGSVETVGRTIGAIVFNLEDSTVNRVYVAPGNRTARICNAPVGYQWMELLRPGGAPADALPAKP